MAYGIGESAPLTLYGKDDPGHLDAALAAIDTLQRFVKRWEFDKRAKQVAEQRISDVWSSVTESVARDAGIPKQADRAVTIMGELLEHAELLADGLLYFVRASQPESNRRADHARAFARAVSTEGSDAHACWVGTARLFVSVVPLVLETHAAQHVSATKGYFVRLGLRWRPAPVTIDVPVAIVDDLPDAPEPLPVGPTVTVVVVKPADPDPGPGPDADPESPRDPEPSPGPTPSPGPSVPAEQELITLVDPVVDPGAVPPTFLLHDFNPRDFAAIMGAKQGPLVRLRIRTDAKVDMVTQLAAFNAVGATDEARRAALGPLVDHCERYIQDNVRNAERKAGRLDYVRALQEAARWERTQGHALSARRDDAEWRLTPTRNSVASGIFSGLMALDANAGRIEDLLAHGEEPAKAQETVENLDSVATKLSSTAGEAKLTGLTAFLRSIADGVNLDNIGEAAGMYLDFLDFVDVSGLGKLATAHQAFKDYKRTARRIEALDRRKDSTDWFIREFVGYAKGKLGRRQASSIFLGISNFIGGLSRILTLVTGATVAVVTEAIGLSTTIAGAIYNVFRDLKGTYKYVLGTRGVARKTRAALLIWRASLDATGKGAPDLPDLAALLRGQTLPGDLSEAGVALRALTHSLKSDATALALRDRLRRGEPTEALALFKDFLEPDFVTGFSIIKRARQFVWDRLWGAGHEAVRIVIALAIEVVKSDTGMLDVLKRAAAAHKADERARILLAMRVSLSVQKLVFEALSSRPKLGASSWLANRQDAFLEELLTVT